MDMQTVCNDELWGHRVVEIRLRTNLEDEASKDDVTSLRDDKGT